MIINDFVKRTVKISFGKAEAETVETLVQMSKKIRTGYEDTNI